MEDFGAIYEAYHDMLFAFLMRMCGNRDLAEELTQETFYQAINGSRRFEGKSSVPTWLCGIAKRLYWSNLRDKARAPAPARTEESAPDFAERLIDGDRAMAALHLLHNLSEPYREVFTLRTFCDLSHRQIAELFKKSEAWARVTYYRARQTLIEGMKEADSDESAMPNCP